MKKKGFTLIEVLVVVLIIAVLFAMYSASYESSKITRRNEKARAMFVEFANAARLFNEMYPSQRLVGTFGNTMGVDSSKCPNCKNPCILFEGYTSQGDVDTMHSFVLKPLEWGLYDVGNCSSSFNYDGYDFILCNPYFSNESGAQPDEACNGDRFAVMKIPNDSAYGSRYKGKHVWITNGYDIEDDFNAANAATENTQEEETH